MGSRFLGPMGLLVLRGQLAFFRRRWCQDKRTLHELETTEFVTDLPSFRNRHLSLSVVFKDEGHYRVKLTSIMSRCGTSANWLGPC